MSEPSRNITESVIEELENLEVVIESILFSTPSQISENDIEAADGDVVTINDSEPEVPSDPVTARDVHEPPEKKEKPRKFRLRKKLGKLLSGSKKTFDERSTGDDATHALNSMGDTERPSLSSKDSASVLPERRDDCSEMQKSIDRMVSSSFESRNAAQIQEANNNDNKIGVRKIQALVSLDAATFDIEAVVQAAKFEIDLDDLAKIESDSLSHNRVETYYEAFEESRSKDNRERTEITENFMIESSPNDSNIDNNPKKQTRKNRKVLKTLFSSWMDKSTSKEETSRRPFNLGRGKSSSSLDSAEKKVVQSVIECRQILTSTRFFQSTQRQHGAFATEDNKLKERVEGIYNAFRTQKQTRTKLKYQVFSWLLKNGATLYSDFRTTDKDYPPYDGKSEATTSVRSPRFSEQEILNAGMMVVQRRIGDIFRSVNIQNRTQLSQLQNVLMMRLLRIGSSESFLSAGSQNMATAASQESLATKGFGATEDRVDEKVPSVHSDKLNVLSPQRSESYIQLDASSKTKSFEEAPIEMLSMVHDTSQPFVVRNSTAEDGEGFNVIYDTCRNFCGILPLDRLGTDCSLSMKSSFSLRSKGIQPCASIDPILDHDLALTDEAGDAELIHALVTLWSSSQEENLKEHKDHTLVKSTLIEGNEGVEEPSNAQCVSTAYESSNEAVPVTEECNVSQLPSTEQPASSIADLFSQKWRFYGAATSSGLEAFNIHDAVAKSVADVTGALASITLNGSTTEALDRKTSKQSMSQSQHEEDFVNSFISKFRPQHKLIRAESNRQDIVSAVMKSPSDHQQIQLIKEACLEKNQIDLQQQHNQFKGESVQHAPVDQSNVVEKPQEPVKSMNDSDAQKQEGEISAFQTAASAEALMGGATHLCASDGKTDDGEKVDSSRARGKKMVAKDQRPETKDGDNSNTNTKKRRRRTRRVISPRSSSSRSFLDPIFEHPEEVPSKLSADFSNQSVDDDKASPIRAFFSDDGMDLVVDYKLESMSMMWDDKSASKSAVNEITKEAKDPLNEISKSSSEEPRLFLSVEESFSSDGNSFSESDSYKDDVSSCVHSTRDGIEECYSGSLNQASASLDEESSGSLGMSQTFSQSLGSTITDQASTLSSASTASEKEDSVWSSFGLRSDSTITIDSSKRSDLGGNTFESSLGSVEGADTHDDRSFHDQEGELSDHSFGEDEEERNAEEEKQNEVSSGGDEDQSIFEDGIERVLDVKRMKRSRRRNRLRQMSSGLLKPGRRNRRKDIDPSHDAKMRNRENATEGGIHAEFTPYGKKSEAPNPNIDAEKVNSPPISPREAVLHLETDSLVDERLPEMEKETAMWSQLPYKVKPMSPLAKSKNKNTKNKEKRRWSFLPSSPRKGSHNVPAAQYRDDRDSTNSRSEQDGRDSESVDADENPMIPMPPGLLQS